MARSMRSLSSLISHSLPNPENFVMFKFMYAAIYLIDLYVDGHSSDGPFLDGS